ncbi:MAG: PIN domain-containing protein [Spirochaetes bacterium]|nr:PIN domain-containing protein [Spirochaetota bacterium]
MKILVDTDVLSEALRRKDKNINSTDTLLYNLINNDEQIILTGIILQEILSGITNNNLFNDIKNILIDFQYIEPKKDNYIFAAELRNFLKQKGYTVGTIDLLIASIAINNNLHLATYDEHYNIIAKFTNLKILDKGKYLKIKT